MALRVAAGLAATAITEARKLPAQLSGLPAAVVGQAFQLSLRAQQQLADLAVRGDEALAALRPVQDKPEWATFDEDEEKPDLWSQEEQALSTEELADKIVLANNQNTPQSLPGYDELSVAQVRARLRRLSLGQLEELLAYEQVHGNRPAFTTMLTRRIDTVRNQVGHSDS